MRTGLLSRLFCRRKDAAAWIEIPELERRVAAGDDFVLIDVRRPEEFTAPPGHLPGAINIPLGDLPSRTEELMAQCRIARCRTASGRPIVLVCKSDRRSAQAAAALLAAGLQDVAVLRGGTDAWHRQGLALE
ncbi:MAG: rhodanese-like domain-containing protein [Stellaceae bacterium]